MMQKSSPKLRQENMTVSLNDSIQNCLIILNDKGLVANNKYYRALSEDAKDFLAQMLQSDPSKRYSAKVALQHPWLQGQTSSTLPLPEGHAQRIEAYLRLQKLRANVLAVIMGLSHSNIINSSINTSQTQMEQKIQTANLDMFKEAFAIFDRDDSGDIDREELRVVLMALGQNVYMTEIEEMMKQADSDGDGKISFDEFVSMMSKRLLNKGQFTEADLKASFKVNKSEHDDAIPLQFN
jgi:Ca2+-binding EF-hand superfamily protein